MLERKTRRFCSSIGAAMLLCLCLGALSSVGETPPIKDKAASAAQEKSRLYQGFWAFSMGKSFLSEAETTEMIRVARENNINAIFPEIRKSGDAYYKSELEPRGDNINPKYADPLADIIKKCHDTSGGKQYIEVHAWVVPYRVVNDNQGEPPSSHVARRHPEWLTVSYSGEKTRGTLDPGIPEVENYLIDIIMELVNKYDVDGIHFDYIRYFGEEWGYNPVAVARFNSLYGKQGKPEMKDPDWCNFRRDQIKDLVRKAYAKAKEARWAIKMSAAVVGFNPPPPNGDFTKTRPYYEVFQDWPSMMEEGSIDLLCQMNYKREFIAEQKEGFRDWTKFSASKKADRLAVIGLGNYLNTPEDNVTQMNWALACPGVDGTMVYRYGESASKGTEASAWKAVREKVYNQRRDVPLTEWITKPTFGILYGTVRDATGSVVDGASVTLGGGASGTVKTDGTGFYAFLKVPQGGGYTVTATSHSTQVTLPFDVATGKVTVKDIALSKR